MMFRLLYNIYAGIIFTALMLLIFPIAVLGAFFGPIRGGNIIYGLCTIWAELWFALIFMDVKRIDEATFDPSQKAIIVANHIAYLDIPVMVKVFKKPLRALGKVEMAKIPIFGFMYRRAIVTVDRKTAAGRARSIGLLRTVINQGISIFVFPEGTFNETQKPLKDFYNGAFRLALETQTPIRPVLFLDTFARMPYSKKFPLNPGRCRVVILEEVSVKGLELRDYEILKKRVYDIMARKLVQYNASWINPHKPIV